MGQLSVIHFRARVPEAEIATGKRPCPSGQKQCPPLADDAARGGPDAMRGGSGSVVSASRLPAGEINYQDESLRYSSLRRS